MKKFGDRVKGGIKKVGRGVAVVTLAVPRTAFLSLLDLNYRGFGWKIQSILTNPALSKEKKQLKKKWEKLGGKFSALEKTAGIGSRREKAFFCGKKCARQATELLLHYGILKRSQPKATCNMEL